MSWIIKPTFVTFIIPTIGRQSLKRTIGSLLEQPQWNWRCHIVFDGIDPIKIEGLPIDYLNDNHFIIEKCEKQNHAGLVRNIAIPKVDTNWIAFVDDDDWLAPTYISSLHNYINKDLNLDLVIFTYQNKVTNSIFPPKGSTDFNACAVGISFAIKTSFVKEHNILFTQGAVEDFRFLDDARNAGAKYIVTNEIQYFTSGAGGWL